MIKSLLINGSSALAPRYISRAPPAVARSIRSMDWRPTNCSFRPSRQAGASAELLKVRFLSHLILRGLGQGFGCLRFAAILFGEGHGSITLPFARQITLHRQARHPSEDEDRQHRQEDVRPLETARKAAPGRPEGTGSAFPAAAGTFPSPSCETRVLLPARKSGAVRI
jgi:hypothetical protein